MNCTECRSEGTQACIACLRDRLRVVALMLVEAAGADGPMDAEDAARGAVHEWRRKYEAMCGLAQAQCLEMQGMGHWKDQECDKLCLFFGDAQAERGGKQ